MRKRLRSISLMVLATMSSMVVFAQDVANEDRSDRQNDVAVGRVVPVLRLDEGEPLKFEFGLANRTDEIFRYGGSRTHVQQMFFLAYHNGQRLESNVNICHLFVEALLAPRGRLMLDFDVENLYWRPKLQPGRYELHAIYNTPPGNAFSLTPLNIDKPLLQFVIE